MVIDITNLPDIGTRSPADMLELLAKPFRPELIRSRKVGGRNVEYLPTGAVIERLNRAAGAWDFTIMTRTDTEMELPRWDDTTRKMITRATRVHVVVGRLTIPGLGSRDGTGVAAIDPGSPEDSLKGADSDALKRAARLFGMWQPGETP